MFHTPQVGISVAALAETVKRLGLSQRHLTTGEVAARWLLPPTRLTQCRWGWGWGQGLRRGLRRAVRCAMWRHV